MGERLMSNFYHYVISEKNAEDRRASILTNFQSHGVEPQFFDAIMGNELTPKELESLAVDLGVMRLGEVGCALSHLGVYKNLLESQKPYIFVFEDDVQLNTVFFQELADLQKFLDRHTEPLVLLLYKAVAHTKPIVYKEGKPFILRALAGTEGHGYVINRKAAENILRFQTPPRIEIDAWAQYLKFNLLEIYCMEEKLVQLNALYEQNSLIDTIDSRDRKDLKYLKKMKQKRIDDFYNQLSLSEKLLLQGKRFWRHIQELYYDKEVQSK